MSGVVEVRLSPDADDAVIRLLEQRLQLFETLDHKSLAVLLVEEVVVRRIVDHYGLRRGVGIILDQPVQEVNLREFHNLTRLADGDGGLVKVLNLSREAGLLPYVKLLEVGGLGASLHHGQGVMFIVHCFETSLKLAKLLLKFYVPFSLVSALLSYLDANLILEDRFLLLLEETGSGVLQVELLLAIKGFDQGSLRMRLINRLF